MARILLLTKNDGKLAKITVPDDAKCTFGPFSVPTKSGGSGNMSGTLRVYNATKTNIIACISGLESFRENNLPFEEQVAVEVGDTIWHNSQTGYKREHRVQEDVRWVDPARTLEGKVVTKKARKKGSK